MSETMELKVVGATAGAVVVPVVVVGAVVGAVVVIAKDVESVSIVVHGSVTITVTPLVTVVYVVYETSLLLVSAADVVHGSVTVTVLPLVTVVYVVYDVEDSVHFSHGSVKTVVDNAVLVDATSTVEEALVLLLLLLLLLLLVLLLVVVTIDEPAGFKEVGITEDIGGAEDDDGLKDGTVDEEDEDVGDELTSQS
jgi:hypothetical protein